MGPTLDPPSDSRVKTDRQIRDDLGDVGRAFFNFPSLSDVQRAALPPIAEGRNVLVCAATAAGKTEAVLAPLIWALRRRPRARTPGPRLLAVAPTRALVADLVARLENPLAALGWRCAAQTNDFSGADIEPEVLITTPESFDSMLVRRIRRDRGETVGHLLANIGGVFVDEAHCFDSSPRGDQLIFLLGRLRGLRKWGQASNWAPDASVQVCAASATVHEPQLLAERLLGPGSSAVVCAGSRPIDVLTAQLSWRRMATSDSVIELANVLPTGDTLRVLGPLLWEALKSGEYRKALVFVPSRRQCDLLARGLRRFLQRRRHIWVDAHHGSLSREHRQRTEKSFHAERDAVLVATNTLEVGVDIGDVDTVVLVGAPPDTSSLLQRIGRGGRRSGLTKIIPIARHRVDAAALASELIGAVAGQLEPKRRFPRWDVLPQQIISYIRQNQGQGRAESALADLASTAWQMDGTRVIAEGLIQAWRNDGRLSDHRGRLHLGAGWDRYAAHAESDFTMHSNIRSGTAGLTVRNETTGEIIANVPDGGSTHTITVGGRQHRIVRYDEGLVVAPVSDQEVDQREDAPRYGGRRRWISETFAAHVRRGCGLADRQAPLVETSGHTLWFHFGGEAHEGALRYLFPELIGSVSISGVAVRMHKSSGAVLAFSDLDRAKLSKFVTEQGLRLLEDEGLGRFGSDLPDVGIDAMLRDLSFPVRFADWLKTREIGSVQPLSSWPTLAGLF